MASITLTELTNGTIVNNQWEGSGIFDILIEAVNKNIEIQYNLGRLKGTDYANVYLQGMQASIQQASDFLLKQRELEVKLDIFTEEAKLARANTSLSIAKALAEIKKQYGFEAILNLDGTISIGADLQNGIIDKELELKTKQINTAMAEIALKEEQLIVMRSEASLKTAQTEAEIEKQYGYEVTKDINGNLILGSSTDNGIIDKELELKSKQVELSAKDIELKTEQIDVMKLETSLKTAQSQAEIKKQYGFAVTVDVDGNLIVGTDLQNGIIDKELELKTKQVELSAADILLKAEQIDTMKLEMSIKATQTEADIEKQYGYDITKDIDGTLILGNSTGNGVIDKELELKAKQIDISTKEIELKAKQISVMELENSIKSAQSEAEIEKQYGYVITRDINGNLVLGANLGAGIIDKELELKTKQVEKTVEDIKVITTQKIKLDKETALLGLDDVMKINMEAKDGTYVYNPSYTA